MPDIVDYRARFTGDDSGFQKAAGGVLSSLGKLDKALADTTKVVAGLDAEMKGTGIDFGAMAKGAGALASTVRSLRTALSPQAVSAYATALERLAKVLPDLAKGFGSVNGVFPAFNAELRTSIGILQTAATEARVATGTIDALAASLKGVKAMSNVSIRATATIASGGATGALQGIEKFGSAAGKFSAKVALPILALGTAAAAVSMHFSDATTRIQGFAGASAAEVASLRPKFMDLGESVGIMADQMAEGFFHIRSGGLKGAEGLDVLKTSATAAAAGLGKMEEVAYVITSAKYSFHKTAAEIGDIVAKAATLSHADPSEFFRNMGQAIPIAATLGIKLNDVAAAVAIMTREGLSPAKGFQRITALMDSLSKPSKAQKTVALDMKIDIGQFRKRMGDDMAAAFEEVQTKAKGNLEKIRAFFGARRAGDPALAFFNPNAIEENRKVFEGMRQTAGTVANAYKAAAATTGFAWRQAMVSINNAAISLGDSIAPTVKGIASAIKSGADAFRSWSPELKSAAVNAGLAVGALGLLFGAASKIATGALAIRGLGVALGLVSAAAPAAAAGTAAVGVAGATASIALWPYALAIGAVAAAGYGLYRLYKYLNPSVEEQTRAAQSDSAEQVRSAVAKVAHAKRVQDLYKQVETLTGKHKKSKEETERLQGALNALSTAAPEYIRGYDSLGNAIGAIGGKAQETERSVAEMNRRLHESNVLNNYNQRELPALNTQAEKQGLYDEARNRFLQVSARRQRGEFNPGTGKYYEEPVHDERAAIAAKEFRDAQAALNAAKAATKQAHDDIVRVNDASKNYTPESLKVSKMAGGYLGSAQHVQNTLSGQLGLGRTAHQSTKIDVEGEYDPSTPKKGRKPPKSEALKEEERATAALKAKLEDLTIAYRAIGDDSHDAALKGEILYGQFASGKTKAENFAAALKNLSSKHLPELEKAMNELFHKSFKTWDLDKMAWTSPRLDTNNKEHMAAASLAEDRLVEAQKKKHAANIAMRARMDEIHQSANKAEAKTDFLPGSKDAIAYGLVGKTLGDIDPSNKRLLADIDAIYMKQFHAALNKGKALVAEINKKTSPRDDIVGKMFGEGMSYADLDKMPDAAKRKAGVDHVYFAQQAKEAAKDAKEAAKSYDEYTHALGRNLQVLKRESADAGAKETDASRRAQAIKDAMNSVLMPTFEDFDSYSDMAAKIDAYAAGQNKAGRVGGDAYDNKAKARYAQDYADALKGTVNELNEYEKATDAARIASIEFDANGIRQMTHGQAALVVAMQKTVEKAKVQREEMKKLANGLGDLFGNTLQGVFQNGFRGLFASLLSETRNFLQQMVVELYKSQVTQWFQKVLAPKNGQQQATTGFLQQAAGAGGSTGGFWGTIGGLASGATSIAGLLGRGGGGGGAAAGASAGSVIGGAFAMGGRVAADVPIVVGDRRGMQNAEVFIPDSSGRIDPGTGNLSTTNNSSIQAHFHFPNVTDSGEARKTGTQAATAFQQHMALAGEVS